MGLLDILRDSIWTGIGAVIAIIALVVTLWPSDDHVDMPKNNTNITNSTFTNQTVGNNSPIIIERK